MVSFETFETLRRTEAAFNEFVVRQISVRLHWFMGNHAAHGLLDSEDLVARALMGLVHPLLNPRGDAHLLVSQKELASLATMSRQRCNAALVELTTAGIV